MTPFFHAQPAHHAGKKRVRTGKQVSFSPLALLAGTVLSICSGLPLTGHSSACAADPIPESLTFGTYEQDLLPFIRKYCADCHGNGAQEGDFSLDRYADLNSLHRDRAIWTKLLKLVELESMPPSSADQPSPQERAKVVAWLNHELFFVDCSQLQSPGRVTIRRLNRTEYNNTVNSLLGIQFKPADNFPSDDVGHGFDNIADVLTVPPLLIEKYLAAAEFVAAIAIQNRSPVYAHQPLPAVLWKNEGGVAERQGGKAFVSRGTISTDIELPRSGPYRLLIRARQDKGGDEPAKMKVVVKGEELKTVAVRSPRSFDLFELPFEWTGTGKTEISISFINDFYDPKAKKNGDRNLHVSEVAVEGPLDLTGEEKKFPRLIQYQPGPGLTVQQAASRNLEAFLPRAFRRPATPEEVNRFVRVVERGIAEKLTFKESMGLALQAILISPDFLFRVEGGRRREGSVEVLDDFALASRLSYFLWSSCPDQHLYDLARAGRLHEPEILKAQTVRMLADPRADELITNFSSQWLGLRKLGTREVAPDLNKFPEFTPEIRADLWKETELFFSSVVRENRSIFDLLTGRYTFLNDRLAKFYGVEGKHGREFQKVDQPAHRMGVLTQGSVLTLTSYPDRTSPVKRGEWVLAVLLGDAPPPPPPAVPGLEQTSEKNPNLSFREALELHRTDPGCASCHRTMDAVGFSLENFDAIGRWRSEDKGRPVDAKGELPDGTQIASVDELVGVLVKRQDEFARHLTEKMMTFALGRGVDWRDRCAVEEILQQLKQDDRFLTLVLGVVNSAPFQSRSIPIATDTESQPTSQKQ